MDLNDKFKLRVNIWLSFLSASCIFPGCCSYKILSGNYPDHSWSFSSQLKRICILWTNFGIDVIWLQLWPVHIGGDHHRWSLLIVFSHVLIHYWPLVCYPYWGQHRRELWLSQISELYLMVVSTTNSAWMSWWSLSLSILDHCNKYFHLSAPFVCVSAFVIHISPVVVQGSKMTMILQAMI